MFIPWVGRLVGGFSLAFSYFFFEFPRQRGDRKARKDKKETKEKKKVEPLQHAKKRLMRYDEGHQVDETEKQNGKMLEKVKAC